MFIFFSWKDKEKEGDKCSVIKPDQLVLTKTIRNKRGSYQKTDKDSNLKAQNAGEVSRTMLTDKATCRQEGSETVPGEC